VNPRGANDVASLRNAPSVLVSALPNPARWLEVLMNTIEITVLGPKAALREFADVWQRVEEGGDGVPRLAFGSIRDLFSAITEKRLELLRYVASHAGLNVRRLADGLGRDYKNVHTDVSELLELGLLERGDDGRLTAPFDEIVIRAGICDAA
jgi:predicted transcriptional regulator